HATPPPTHAALRHAPDRIPVSPSPLPIHAAHLPVAALAHSVRRIGTPMPPLRAALLAALSLITLPARAGDPPPPPGPVTGTMKTLTQVEPRTPLNDLPGDAAYIDRKSVV